MPAGLPFPSREISPFDRVDFDSDGVYERLEVIEGHARIMTGDVLRWQSPPSWDVRQAALGDLNRDGSIEAVLLVWRPFKPWPVDQWLPSGGRIAEFQDAQGESCHIILIGWHRAEFTERWAGSALAEPIRSFALADMNQDGFDELVALESIYETTAASPANALKIWEWNGFGFSLVSEQKGYFSDLKVLNASDRNPILVTP